MNKNIIILPINTDKAKASIQPFTYNTFQIIHLLLKVTAYQAQAHHINPMLLSPTTTIDN
jgi:hypothetical protein